MADTTPPEQVVIVSIFSDEAAADRAVNGLKAWASEYRDIDLTTCGILVLDVTGRLKEHKMGPRSAERGIGRGGLLAATFRPSVLLGGDDDAIRRRLYDADVGVTETQQQHLVDELQSGKAAVAMVSSTTAEPEVSQLLTTLGGTVETLVVMRAEPADAEDAAGSGPGRAEVGSRRRDAVRAVHRGRRGPLIARPT
jgi:hypothetical protein